MADRPAQLPDYREPPIDEVVIAAQFPAIPDLTDSHIREFWKSVRDEYPISEHQPRLEGPIESSGPARPITLEFPAPGTIPPPMRTWMISETDDFLIQVQNTRFIQNWRRRQEQYPHFEEIRDKFWASFTKFRSFLDGQNIASPLVQQIEISYVNWIPALPMVEFLRPASATALTIGEETKYPEEQNWSARYLLGDSEGLIQRLYVQCMPAVRPATPEVRGTQLGFVFRGAKEDGLTDDEMSGLMASGRVVIGKTFTQITTPAAQEMWGRYK